MPRWLTIAALTLLASHQASAQSLSVSPLVVSQPYHLSFDAGQPAPGDVVLVLSTSGLGPGLCHPAVPFCLDILEPTAIVAVVPLDLNGQASLSGFVPPSGLPLTLDLQAVFVSFGGGAPVLAKSGPVEIDVEDISAFSDDFEGPALDVAWSVHQPALVNIAIGNGALELTPTLSGPAATWFDGGEGPLVWKAVTGDFDVRATVHARSSLLAGAPVPISYRLAGILARSPVSDTGPHEFVHVAVGAGVPGMPFVVEDKTTTNSISNFLLYPIASQDGEIRITRVGPSFSLWFRDVGAANWTLLRTHVHPGMPATVQVGPMAYSFSSPADIVATFDEIVFVP